MAILDICFSSDGNRFLTSSYDKGIKCWDSESGKVISTFTTEDIPFVVKFNPDKDKQNVMLVGMSNGTIVRWDLRVKEHNQVYDRHVGEVNSITFVDRNRSFLSSSSNKSVVLWKFEVTQVLNYIRESHAIQSMSLHPTSNCLAAQTTDDKILVYCTGEYFARIKQKIFAGHKVYDACCEVNISIDGNHVLSGDAQGQCWLWDWHSCEVCKTLQCHEGACFGAAWHPLDQNIFATWMDLLSFGHMRICRLLQRRQMLS